MNKINRYLVTTFAAMSVGALSIGAFALELKDRDPAAKVKLQKNLDTTLMTLKSTMDDGGTALYQALSGTSMSVTGSVLATIVPTMVGDADKSTSTKVVFTFSNGFKVPEFRGKKIQFDIGIDQDATTKLNAPNDDTNLGVIYDFGQVVCTTTVAAGNDSHDGENVPKVVKMFTSIRSCNEVASI